MILTGDDHLWFLSDGLWRWERGAWREIRSDLHLPDAVPVGHSQDRVWLWLRRSGEVVSITPDGSVARRAGLRELGLEYGTQIRDVAESRGEIRIATDEGLVSFENGKWRNFRRPPGTAAVTDVALGPDGSTWVIGETRPIGNLIRSRSLPLGIAMLSMVALGILISKWLRGKAENNLASEEQLVAAAGPLPGVDLNHAQAGIEQQDRWVSWRLCYVLAGILFAGILEEGLAWRLQNRWPAVPHWIISVAIVLSVVCLVPAFSFWVTRRRFIRNGVMVSFWRYRKAARKPAKLLLCIAIVTVLGFKPATWMASVVPNPLFSALAMLPMAFVPLAALFAGRDIIATLMVRPAWRVGNYDRALRILHRLSLGLPSMKIVDLLGVTYALAGRPSEAEAYIRTVLANTQANAPANQCSLLGCLAEAIGDQGRLEEARRCLEASVAIGDDVLGSSRVDLAELLLQQGSEPLRALRLLDEALSIAKGPIGRLLAPARASSRAWALALLGRRDEAAAAIETSMTFRREAQAALFADTRLKAGMALLVMDQKDKALEQFRAAREADSQGKVGARAARQIELLRA